MVGNITGGCLFDSVLTIWCIRSEYMLCNGDPYYIINLDFKKAFDQISHKRLAVKLQSYGMTSKLHRCISCFSSN